MRDTLFSFKEALKNQQEAIEYLYDIAGSMSLTRHFNSIKHDHKVCAKILHQLIVNRDSLSIKLLFDKVNPAEIAKTYFVTYMESPLHTAVIAGDCDAVKILLRNNLKQSARELDKKFPLHLIATECPEESRVSMAKLLLQNGGKLNVTNKQGETPLGSLIALPTEQIPEELAIFYIQNKAPLSKKTVNLKDCMKIAGTDEKKQWLIFLWLCAQDRKKDVQSMLEQHHFLIPASYTEQDKDHKQSIIENYDKLNLLFKTLASTGAVEVTAIIFEKMGMSLIRHAQNKHEIPTYDEFLTTLYLSAHRFRQENFLRWLDTYYQPDPALVYTRLITAAEEGDLETVKSLFAKDSDRLNVIRAAASHGHLNFVLAFISYSKFELNSPDFISILEEALQHHQLLFIADWQTQDSVVTRFCTLETGLALVERYNAYLFARLILNLADQDDLLNSQAIIKEKIKNIQNDQLKLLLLSALMELAIVENENIDFVLCSLYFLAQKKENIFSTAVFFVHYKIRLEHFLEIFVLSDKQPIEARLFWGHLLLTHKNIRPIETMNKIMLFIRQHLEHFSVEEIVNFFGLHFMFNQPLFSGMAVVRLEPNLKSHYRLFIINFEACLRTIHLEDKVANIRYMLKDLNNFKPSSTLLNLFIADFFSFHEQLNDEEIKKFLSYFYKNSGNVLKVESPNNYLSMIYYIKNRLSIITSEPLIDIESSDGISEIIIQLEYLRDEKNYTPERSAVFFEQLTAVSSLYFNDNLYFFPHIVELFFRDYKKFEITQIKKFITWVNDADERRKQSYRLNVEYPTIKLHELMLNYRAELFDILSSVLASETTADSSVLAGCLAFIMNDNQLYNQMVTIALDIIEKTKNAEVSEKIIISLIISALEFNDVNNFKVLVTTYRQQLTLDAYKEIIKFLPFNFRSIWFECTPNNIFLKQACFINLYPFNNELNDAIIVLLLKALEQDGDFEQMLSGVDLNALGTAHYQFINDNKDWSMIFLNAVLETANPIQYLCQGVPYSIYGSRPPVGLIFEKHLADLLTIKKEENNIDHLLKIIVVNLNLREKYRDSFTTNSPQRCEKLMLELVSGENISEEILNKLIAAIEDINNIHLRRQYFTCMFSNQDLSNLIREGNFTFSNERALANIKKLLAFNQSNASEKEKKDVDEILKTLTDNCLLNLCTTFEVKVKKPDLLMGEKKQIAENLLNIIRLVRIGFINKDFLKPCLETLDEMFNTHALNQAIDEEYCALKYDYYLLAAETIMFDDLMIIHSDIPEEAETYFNPDLTNTSEEDKKLIMLINSGILAYRYLVEITDINNEHANTLRKNICQYYLTGNPFIQTDKSKTIPWHPYAISLMGMIYPQSPELQLQIKMAAQKEFLALTAPLPANRVESPNPDAPVNEAEPANAVAAIKPDENSAQNWAVFLTKLPIARGKTTAEVPLPQAANSLGI